jgi:hypothetical protein
MCRLHGVGSVLQSQVHRSLVEADNALAEPRQAHPEGQGVANRSGGSPQATTGVVDGPIPSSERPRGDDAWREMEPGQVAGVGWRGRLTVQRRVGLAV